MRWVARRDETQLRERKRIANLDRGAQVPVVNGVERATEQPERAAAQKLEPGCVRNAISSGVESRPSIALRCG